MEAHPLPDDLAEGWSSWQNGPAAKMIRLQRHQALFDVSTGEILVKATAETST